MARCERCFRARACCLRNRRSVRKIWFTLVFDAIRYIVSCSQGPGMCRMSQIRSILRLSRALYAV